ncbi:hypothetical protein, partial [Vibrio anguillarum]|uniref:hypothetical protein n=1 Tax=Vibrio anguillarum TaxID=55601 RepID=UPI001BE49E96
FEKIFVARMIRIPSWVYVSIIVDWLSNEELSLPWYSKAQPISYFEKQILSSIFNAKIIATALALKPL